MSKLNLFGIMQSYAAGPTVPGCNPAEYIPDIVAEVERLTALNAELVEALDDYVNGDEIAQGFGYGVGGEEQDNAKALLAKARGQQ